MLAAVLALVALQDDDVFQRTVEALPRGDAGAWEGAFEPAGMELLRQASAGALQSLEAGANAYGAGDYRAALEEFHVVLEVEPDFPPALLNAATVYFRLHRYGDVLECMDRMLVVVPDGVGRSKLRGHALYGLGQYEEARAHYERVLERRPEDFETRRGLGLALYRLGEEAAALEQLERVVAERPQHADAWAWIAQVHFDAGSLEPARAASDRAIELAPFDPRAWFLQSRILRELGLRPAAESARTRWEELDRAAQEVRALEARLHYDPRDLADVRALVDWHLSVANTGAAASVVRRYAALQRPADDELAYWRWAASIADRIDDISLKVEVAQGLRAAIARRAQGR